MIKAKSLQLIFKLFRIGFKKQIKCLDIKKEVYFSYVRKILYFICGIENFEGTGGIFCQFFFEKVHEMKEILCRSVTCGIVMYIVSYDFGISDLPT